MRFLTLAIFLVGSALVAACDQDLTPTVAQLAGPASTSAVPTLVITPNQIQIPLNSAFQLATNAPAGLETQLQWNSLSSTIATVSPTGLVNAVGVGTAVITARYSFDTTNVAAANVTVFTSGMP